jgi:hypothetical protein
MLKFVCELVSEYPYILMEANVNRAIVSGELTKRILLKINRTEAVHFYNLPTLETVLECLLHITARPGWSCECADMNSVTLCQQLLQSMVEVGDLLAMSKSCRVTYLLTVVVFELVFQVKQTKIFALLFRCCSRFTMVAEV